MNLPWYLLFPLVAAIGYAIASLLLKKALVEGARPMGLGCGCCLTWNRC